MTRIQNILNISCSSFLASPLPSIVHSLESIDLFRIFNYELITKEHHQLLSLSKLQNTALKKLLKRYTNQFSQMLIKKLSMIQKAEIKNQKQIDSASNFKSKDFKRIYRIWLEHWIDAQYLFGSIFYFTMEYSQKKALLLMPFHGCTMYNLQASSTNDFY